MKLSFIIFTDRVRSTTGRLCFDTCLSVCPCVGGVPWPGPDGGGAGGYPARGYPCWGVPQLGYPPSWAWLGVPYWGYPISGTPCRTWGYPCWGYPTLGTPHETWGVPLLGFLLLLFWVDICLSLTVKEVLCSIFQHINYHEKPTTLQVWSDRESFTNACFTVSYKEVMVHLRVDRYVTNASYFAFKNWIFSSRISYFFYFGTYWSCGVTSFSHNVITFLLALTKKAYQED